MKILWLTWKDIKHSEAGGAEVVNEELAKRLAKDGHELILITAKNKNDTLKVTKEVRNGFTVFRMGNKYTIYLHAFFYTWKNFYNWADVVIDEINTVPFFSNFYLKGKKFLFVHQLAREIWFYQMIFPVSIIGYILEPVYLWVLSKQKVITVSESTKKDLMRYGFKSENIGIISEGIELAPLESIAAITKFPSKTILSLGAIRPMKRTLEIVKAFELLMATTPASGHQNNYPGFQPPLLKKGNPEQEGEKKSQLQLIIAGSASGKYGDEVIKYVENSKYKNNIIIKGKVSYEEKLELMQKSHVLAVTSLKEGWGLVVTEAASQGTPAVVYNVDGLRDSVQHEKTGLVCSANTPANLAQNLSQILRDPNAYQTYRHNAWETSKKITFEQSYTDFITILQK